MLGQVTFQLVSQSSRLGAVFVGLVFRQVYFCLGKREELAVIDVLAGQSASLASSG